MRPHARAPIHRPIEQSDPQHYFATVRPEVSDLGRPRLPERRVLVQPYRAPRSGLLPELSEHESFGKRALFTAIAVVVAASFFAINFCYWVPASPGIDQNAYLVGGRMLAEHGEVSFSPAEPYAFVGAMWVGIGLDSSRPQDSSLDPRPEPPRDFPNYFPKYPIGLPLLNALCIKAGPIWASARPHLIDQPMLRSTALWLGRGDGTTLAFLLSPLFMTLGLMAMFFLGRLVGGSFGGIMAMLLLATSQVTLALVNNPNSHATDLCFVTWGLYWLARWWQSDRLWRGLLAGLLLGCAVTIRYAEVLLLLPVLIAAIALPWRRSWMVVVAWALPVGALIWFNLHFIGHYTGYDQTHESAGFSWHDLLGKWEFVTQELYDSSIFFLPPIAVAGLIAIFGHSRRWGLLLSSWFVPGAALCAAYYWGGNTFGAGYLRLYFSLFPPLILAGVWLIVTQARSVLAAGVIVAIASTVGLHLSLPAMEREQASNLNLAYTVDRIVGHLPATGSTVIADERSNLSMLDNDLQFAGDFTLFTTDAFRPPPQTNANNVEPSPDQPARHQYLVDFFHGKSDRDLIDEAHRVMQNSLTAGKPVYVVLRPEDSERFRSIYVSDGFTAQRIDQWKEPLDVPAQAKSSQLSPQAHGYVFSWVRGAESFEMWRIQS